MSRVACWQGSTRLKWQHEMGPGMMSSDMFTLGVCAQASHNRYSAHVFNSILPYPKLVVHVLSALTSHRQRQR
jgi:hypothetical protein